MSGFAFEYFGLQVGVEWDDIDLDRSLWDLLLPIWRSEPSLRASARFRVTRDSQGNLLVEGPPDEPYRGARLDVIETLERRTHQLKQVERQLLLESAYLANPERLATRAKDELGLEAPRLEQVIFREEME